MTNPTITHTHGLLDDCESTTNWTQSKTVTLQAGGYVDCGADDIGKAVTDDGGALGLLVWYDNTDRIWTVTTALNVAAGSVMAITAGAGTGTSIGTFTTTVTSDGDIMSLSATPSAVADQYLYVERDITNLSTTVYGKCKVRWKTSETLVALGIRVLLKFTTYDVAQSFDQNVADGDAQWIIGPTDTIVSSIFTVTSETITTGKTLDKICVFAYDFLSVATFTVYVDFMLIYVGDFLFPNCENSGFEPNPKYAIISIPGRSGDQNQNLGSNDAQFHCVCDLDLSNTTDDWKRPQGTLTPKTDYVAGEVFDEIAHRSYTEPWQWLDTGNRQFKAILEKPTFTYQGDKHTVELLFTETRVSSASNETYVERFGLNL